STFFPVTGTVFFFCGARWLGAIFFFFSASGRYLPALTSAFFFLLFRGGPVIFLVGGSLPAMIIEIFMDALSYSSRLAKPFFLATAAACASTFGFGWSGFVPA